MCEPNFDGRRAVVTESEVTGPLVPATGARLVFQKSGFSVLACSPRRSVLVLPVQYSRCWTVSGTGDRVLFRATLMQLGVSFTDELDANLRVSIRTDLHIALSNRGYLGHGTASHSRGEGLKGKNGVAAMKLR
jgi:hypothetical protein